MEIKIGHWAHYDATDWKASFKLEDKEHFQEFIRTGTVSAIGTTYQQMQADAFRKAGEAIQTMLWEVAGQIEREEIFVVEYEGTKSKVVEYKLDRNSKRIT